MLNLTRPNFKKFKGLLLRQKKHVEEEIKEAQKEDPLFSDGLAESVEPGTESWLAEVHSKTTAVRENLQNLLSKIQKSLLRINKGDYGKCENCGKQIEAKRLEAMPTATLCIACSKKSLR